MKRGDKTYLIITQKFTNRKGIEYRTIILDGKSMLLFPKDMFWSENLSLSDYHEGQIVLSNSENNTYPYENIGSWKVFENGYIITIRGKGIYEAFFESFDHANTESQGILYELIL